jgi:hypothetical protein
VSSCPPPAALNGRGSRAGAPTAPPRPQLNPPPPPPPPGLAGGGQDMPGATCFSATSLLPWPRPFCSRPESSTPTITYQAL